MRSKRHQPVNTVGGAAMVDARGAVRRAGWLALLVLMGVAVTLAAASSARAAFGIEPDSATAGTYKADGSAETQAGITPHTGATTFTLNFTEKQEQRSLYPGLPPITQYQTLPEDNLRDMVVDLPPGVVANLRSVPRCPRQNLIGTAEETFFCPASTQVGVVSLTFGNDRFVPSQFASTSKFAVPVYLIEPMKGSLPEFAFTVKDQGLIVLRPSLNPDGYGVRVTGINTVTKLMVIWMKFDIWGVPSSSAFDGIRQRSSPASHIPTAGPGGVSLAERKSFLRNPTSCPGTQPVTSFTARSWQAPNVWESATALSPAVTGCDKLTFAPTVAVKPTTTKPDAPTGLDVDIQIPQHDSPDALMTADLKKAVVTLPEGMTISPAGANGLQACTDAQLGLKTDDPLKCPDGAKVASVEAKSPLIEETLTGGLYIRSQNSQDPESGEMFRLAMVLENKERGLSIRLPGSIRADKTTGRLVTTFDDNPQVPVSSIKLSFKSGPRAPLATPATCGQHAIETQLTSWAGHVVNTSSSFSIDCAAGLGGFLPAFTAGTIDPTAGAYSPFRLRVDKPDTQLPLNGVALKLPTGLLAKVKGNLGTQVGTATVAAGPGSSPFVLSGPVVLEGAYGDAPYSLRVTVPAKAGPFDLGNVIVRQKLYVDRKDAHVTVHSDPLPTIVGGVPVRLQSLMVDVDKPGFMVNPTSCEPKTIHGTLGAATGQQAAVQARFQAGDCGSLPLKPSLSMEFTNVKEMRKDKHPGIEATLRAKDGQANLKEVKVALPLAVALDPDNAKTLCEPDGPAKLSCPADSIIGQAHATTPLLNGPVSGPVYFVKGTRTTATGRVVATLPKLWIPLSGEGINLDLHADSDAVGPSGKQKLVSTFVHVPDVLVDTFKLRINSGKNGILKATTGICGASKGTEATFSGQNGRVTKTTVTGTAPRCKTQIVSASGKASRVSVRVAGIKGGRLTVSGQRVRTTRRTIKTADAATVRADLQLTTSQRRTLNRGRSVKVAVRVAYKPTKGKTVTMKRNATIKG